MTASTFCMAYLAGVFTVAVFLQLGTEQRYEQQIRCKGKEILLEADPKTVLTKNDSDLSEKRLTPILTPDINDPWKKELYGRLDYIRSHCGTLCAIENVKDMEQFLVPNVSPDLFPTLMTPDLNCASIMGLEEADASDLTFPKAIPSELIQYYELSGAIKLTRYQDFFEQGYLEHEAFQNIWTKEEIEDLIQQASKGTLRGTYGAQESQEVYEILSNVDLKQKSVLVIGSERPWVEAILLALGAGKVTTLEYGSIASRHPQIYTETPKSFRAKYLSGELQKEENLFDGVVSHSSVEHSGLGRYGDALNPWGDLIAVARAWCVTKEKGFLYLGVPTGVTKDAKKPGSGLVDRIEYNAHRIYGDVRWPLVTSNWRQVKTANGSSLVNRPGSGGTGLLFEKVSLGELAGGRA